MMLSTSGAIMHGPRMLQGTLALARACSTRPACIVKSRCWAPVPTTTRRYIRPAQDKIDPADAEMQKPARTRFAPSPTGYLHFGSLRTALYNYLLARATGGQFVIRIEDTDRLRLVHDAEPRLYQDLKWAGLTWDEGPDFNGPYGPYRQSDRLSIYENHAKELLDKGKAYRCFCDPEKLDKLKRWQHDFESETHGRYPGTCSHISLAESDRRAASGEPHCIRFKSHESSNPFSGYQPTVNDLVYGPYVRDANGAKPEDSIIIKRDGFPTYHFANVVDDHLMEITCVIRGSEWLPSTPRHVELYDAFGWKPPSFAHVPLLVNSERQKLSKRHGDIDIASWRNKGYLPAALLNYVLLLGWSRRGPNGMPIRGMKEHMDLQDMIDSFHLHFTKGDVVVNDKYQYIQRKHMARLTQTDDPSAWFDHVLPFLMDYIKKFQTMQNAPPALVAALAETSEVPSAAELRLGDMVPKARSAGSSDDIDGGNGGGGDSLSLPYILDTLAQDRKHYTNAGDYIVRNCYMLWQIPREEHESTLREHYDSIFGNLKKVVVEGSTNNNSNNNDNDKPADNETQGVTFSARLHQQRQQGLPPVVHQEDADPLDLVREARDRLAAVDEGSWTKAALTEMVDPFVTSVRRPAEGGGSLKNAGSPVLRWMCLARRPSSSLVGSLAILGKEEVMLRANTAVEVLEEYEKERARRAA